MIETGRALKLAYADPPYLGKSEYYQAHHPEAKIWDDPETHRALVERLQAEFPDGWAMSLSEPSLRVILPMCPADARVGCWLSERPRFACKVAVQRHFEPVIWRGGRSWRETGSRTADYCVTKQVPSPPGVARYRIERERIRNGEVFMGRKPMAFSRWMFNLLGARPSDDFHDLFPGSGAVSAAWAEFCGQKLELPLTPLERAAGSGGDQPGQTQ